MTINPNPTPGVRMDFMKTGGGAKPSAEQLSDIQETLDQIKGFVQMLQEQINTLRECKKE